MFVLVMLIGVGVSALAIGAVGMVSAAKNRKEDAVKDKKRYDLWKNFVNNLEGPTQSQLWIELVKDDAEGIIDKADIRNRHDEIISFNKRTYQGLMDRKESAVVQKDADNRSFSVESRTPELAVAA